MNIIFFGSSEFALPALEELLEAGNKISCVITQEDKKQGRGMQIRYTPIKEFALKNGLNIFQPDNINSPQSSEFLKKHQPDLFIVAAYGQILSPEILAIPKIMPLNIHGSLLPSFRGAAPINWAVIKGESKTGVSIIKMSPRMDAGPIILTKQTAIEENDDALTLENKLSELGAQAMLESISLIKSGKYTLIPQEENKATLAPKLKKDNGRINWEDSALNIRNLIRGCLGWPDAFTSYNGKILKILKAQDTGHKAQEKNKPGTIIQVSPEGILVATGEGSLLIKELQLEGKKRMPSADFVAGHKIKPGEILDNF